MITSSTNVARRLADLFRAAGRAHHEAFIAVNGEDREWPIWYAGYLHPHVNKVLATQWTKSDVVYLLLRSEKERVQQTPMPSWPEFYTSFFLRELESVNA